MLFHELQEAKENKGNNCQDYLSMLELNGGQRQYEAIKECNSQGQNLIETETEYITGDEQAEEYLRTNTQQHNPINPHVYLPCTDYDRNILDEDQKSL